MRRVVGGVLLVGTLLVLVAAAWTASRGWVAYSALQRVRDEVPVLVDAVTAADPDRVAASAARVREDTEEARRATQDPLWRLASRFPLGGENLQALTTTSTAVDGLADDGLPALEQVVTGVDDARTSLRAVAGLDVTALDDAAAALRDAVGALPAVEEATSTARAQIATVDGEHLLPEVEQARDQLLDVLDLGARAEELLATVDVPPEVLAPLQGLRSPTADDVRDIDGDVVPDAVEDGLRRLRDALPGLG
jgi:hypothetical protein